MSLVLVDHFLGGLDVAHLWLESSAVSKSMSTFKLMPKISSRRCSPNQRQNSRLGRNYSTHDRFAYRSTSRRFGAALALVIVRRRARVTEMKTAKFFFAALLLSGSVATYTPVTQSEIPGLLFKEEFGSDSFCRMEIMALTTQGSPANSWFLSARTLAKSSTITAL